MWWELEIGHSSWRFPMSSFSDKHHIFLIGRKQTDKVAMEAITKCFIIVMMQQYRHLIVAADS